MKLPIPIFCNGSIYTDIEIKRAESGVIADTQKVANEIDEYSAMIKFVTGCTESITNDKGDILSDKKRIKQIMTSMSYISVDFVALQIFLKINDDDGIEGIYQCPRCGAQKICELDESNGIDTRDFLNDQKIIYMENFEKKEIEITLDYSVEIVNEVDGQLIEKIENFVIRIPQIKDCINAIQRVGKIDKSRLQFEIYNQALIKVNGNEIDNKYKNRWGKYIFSKMDSMDLMKISKIINQYGIEKKVEKICNNCGKNYKTNLNTASFFDSALQSLEM